LREPLAFGGIFGRLWILTPDVCQHGKTKSRILFNRPQRVGSLDRSVLARVPGQNETAIVFFDERQQFFHLFTADLPGLIHDDDRAARH